MTHSLGFFVDNFSPFLVRFTDNIGIRYYGLAYALGFFVGAWMLERYSRSGLSRLKGGQVGDLMVYVVAGVVLGGRLGSYLLYDGWRSFPADPLGILKVWDGGMSFHGGLAGVAVAVALFARASGTDVSHLWDLLATVAPAGLFFGRIANFINGELWGRMSTVPWAVIFPRSAPGIPVEHIAPRHPSQLYEATLEGVLLFAYLQWRLRSSPKVLLRRGALAGEFLIGYALVRIASEQFREPDVGITPVLGMTRGTFYSAFMLALGLYLRLRPRKGSEAA